VIANPSNSARRTLAHRCDDHLLQKEIDKRPFIQQPLIAAQLLVITTLRTSRHSAAALSTFMVPSTAVRIVPSSATIGQGLATCRIAEHPATALGQCSAHSK